MRRSGSSTNKRRNLTNLSSHQGLLEVFNNKLEEPKLNRLKFVPVISPAFPERMNRNSALPIVQGGEALRVSQFDALLIIRVDRDTFFSFGDRPVR